ncbi:uncharacterized protein LOC126378144 [Pectinophora gossypiella]|uniref:uncharacterized protein LOC126378144 n=1 Tax=Pectinophora gossypiella TaxID=13191 RepID=UPI00214E4FE8|nr:uncharacterized protein LOC126378144 [Pectinophora gossypiella]
MPKRSADEKIAHYQRKIRKLELKENQRRLQVLNTSPVGSSDNEEEPLEDDIPNEEQPMQCLTAIPDPPNVVDQTVLMEPVSVSVDPAQSQDNAAVPELDPEILSALGEAVDDTPKFGEKIHPNLAQRWLPLLRKGLTKEAKENLSKQYLVPENCPLLQAPKLNVEIAAAINEAVRNRDKKLETTQQQLGIGMSAINRAVTLLLTGDDKVAAIKHLSDGCRVLCDLHYMETQTRIKLITPGLAKPFLNVIQDSERDETLFGNKLPEKIKASKAIEKQGLQIKKPATNNNTKSATPNTPTTSRAPVYHYQYQGNWTGPPRYQSNRGGRGGQKRGAVGPTRRAPQPQSRAAGQPKTRAAPQQ